MCARGYEENNNHNYRGVLWGQQGGKSIFLFFFFFHETFVHSKAIVNIITRNISCLQNFGKRKKSIFRKQTKKKKYT